jgi:hypothetical protein
MMDSNPKIDLLRISDFKANVTNTIKQMLSTYPRAWIIIHEALQNALDAIQRSKKDVGNVSIYMDLDEEKVTVKDDGRGFPFKPELLLYGGTDKEQAPEKERLGGNIGVGLKAIIFSAKYFSVDSVVNGKRWKATIRNGHQYSKVATLTPEIEEPRDVEAENGTSISFSFPDNRVTDFIESLYSEYHGLVDDKLAANELDKFTLAVEFYFRAFSYAGNAGRMLGIGNIKPVNIELVIKCSQSQKLNRIKEACLKKLFEQHERILVSFENKQWDVEEAIKRTKPGFSKPTPIKLDLPQSGRFTRQGPDYVYIKSFTRRNQFKNLLNNPIFNDIDPCQYAALFDQLRAVYVVIGSRNVLRSYLLGNERHFLCAQGVPSDNLIEKPRGVGGLGYLANIHCIFDVNARLNFGKQTITNRWLLGKCNQFFTDAYRATLRNVATAFSGKIKTPGIKPIVDVLSIPLIGVSDLTIMTQPVDENQVIALFYELLGKQWIDNIRTYHISSQEMYDGKIIARTPRETDFETPHSNRDLQNLEFKIRVSDLVKDFEKREKFPDHINLLVAWEDDYSNREKPHPDYEMVVKKYAPDEEGIITDAQKCLHARHIGKWIPVIILKDIIAQHVTTSNS